MIVDDRLTLAAETPEEALVEALRGLDLSGTA